MSTRNKALVGLGVLIAVVIGVVIITSEKDDGAYRVRAIFDNAFGLIPGEDVKIAGVKVGSVESMDVTEDKKAAVVLKITQPGFQDFRTSAHCTIRPQSLIGEKFVECTPAEPRLAGAPLAPPLQRIPSGEPGAGQYLLPVSDTSSPVDLDLVANIMRQPYRDRLALIINELGTGVAGRGKELREVIRRANPALEQTDRVLAILASQNRALAELATNSDAVITPLAQRRAQVAGFIESAGDTAQATAERRADLALGLQKLPGFLRQLRPTMVALGDLADETNPVLADTEPVASDISDFIVGLKAFSDAGTPAIDTLGDAADIGTPAVKAAKPIVADLKTLAANSGSVAANLAKLTKSLKDTDGVKRLLQLFYYTVGATNGFDQLGHYYRVQLLANTCITYSIKPVSGCSANFPKKSETSATAARTKGKRASIASMLRRLKRLNEGADQGKQKHQQTARSAGSDQAETTSSDQAALDYLLGDGGGH